MCLTRRLKAFVNLVFQVETEAQRAKRLQQQRIRDQRRREERRNDPVAHKNYCEKEKARNKARKEKGVETKFKKFEDLTARQQRSRRKQQKTWRTNFKEKHHPNIQTRFAQDDGNAANSSERNVVDDELNVNDVTVEENNPSEDVGNAGTSEWNGEGAQSLKNEVKRLKNAIRRKVRRSTNQRRKITKEKDEMHKKIESQRKIITRLRKKIDEQSKKEPSSFEMFEHSIKESNLEKSLQKQLVSISFLTNILLMY